MGKVNGKPSNYNDNNTDSYAVKPFQMSYWHLRKNSNGDSKVVKIPKPRRSGHRIVCDDVNMYLFGGYKTGINSKYLTADDDWLKELWKFNFATSSWSKIVCNEFPEALISHAVHLSGSILMIFGGTYRTFNAHCSHDLYMCDLSKEKPFFSQIHTTGKKPKAEYGQATVLHGKYLYTIGGTSYLSYTPDIHRLNWKDGVWESVYICKGLRNKPPIMFRNDAVLYESKIYVYGGRTISKADSLQGMYAFSIETNEWEFITTHPDSTVTTNGGFPVNRYYHSCVQLPDKPHKIVSLGGIDGYNELGDAWMLDLITFQWEKLKDCSLPSLYDHSSAITPSGRALIFGGVIGKCISKDGTSDIYTSWFCVPKLKEICWDAFVQYNPRLDDYTPAELLSFRVPYEYVQRIYPSR